MLDDDVNVGKQAEETPWVDDKTQGADVTEQIPGVDDTEEEIPEVDDTKGTPGADGEAPETINESDEAEVKKQSIERASGAMILRR